MCSRRQIRAPYYLVCCFFWVVFYLPVDSMKLQWLSNRCIEFKCQESAFWYALVVRCLSIKFSCLRILECSYIVAYLFRWKYNGVAKKYFCKVVVTTIIIQGGSVVKGGDVLLYCCLVPDVNNFIRSLLHGWRKVLMPLEIINHLDPNTIPCWSTPGLLSLLFMLSFQWF